MSVGGNGRCEGVPRRVFGARVSGVTLPLRRVEGLLSGTMGFRASRWLGRLPALRDGGFPGVGPRVCPGVLAWRRRISFGLDGSSGSTKLLTHLFVSLLDFFQLLPDFGTQPIQVQGR